MAVSPSRISLPQRYRVVRHIANGGMAGVWEAHDDRLGRDVAVKVLAQHLSEDERARRRFLREARAAASVSTHPHVVTIYDVGEHDGRSFIVMELLRGGTVADRLRKDGIDRSTALRWVAEAAAALDAAHEAGIVHRDVKPGNLLLDERERLAIADFGIARLALEDQLTATGIVLGTAAYISPEQAQGHDSTTASDRYSLAVVAFELLTGGRPFQAEHFAAQARMHVEDPPPSASERAPLPRAVDDVLARGMAKDPADRWPTAEAFSEALTRAAGGGATTAATVPLGGAGAAAGATAPPPRTPARGAPAAAGPRPARRWPWVALAVLAALAGGLAMALSGGDDPSRDQTPALERPADRERSQDREREREREATPDPTAEATATAAPAGGLDEARRLHLQGFAANNSGDYQSGLDSSLAAIEACGDERSLDPCGYALYEAGRALVGLGRPEEAIPYLERRLQLYGDNAAGDVSELLEQAKGAREEGGEEGPGNGNGKNKDKSDD